MCQVRTGYLNSSYKTMAKGHDDALTIDELMKLVQPSDLLHLTHQHNRPDCIVLWIEYDIHAYSTMICKCDMCCCSFVLSSMHLSHSLCSIVDLIS